ncbi:UDP-N-acetylglucosamine 2-epimerase, partial [Candidatus Pelagibacter bacterium]
MINKKKILSITSSRSDFYLLSNLFNKIKKKYQLDLIVCGNHFDKLYGKTIRVISSKKIGKILKFKTYKKKKNNFVHKLKIYLQQKKPDLVLILGDREESYILASICKKYKIDIFHIAGGDTSLGSKDEFYRNYISKISDHHFVKTNNHKKKLVKLGIKKNIYVVGSLAVENLKSIKKNKFSKIKKPYCLVSFHPVTKTKNFYKDNNLNNLFEVSKYFKNLNFVFTASSHDKGGGKINQRIQKHCKLLSNCFFFKNLGEQYLSAIKNSFLMIGNS